MTIFSGKRIRLIDGNDDTILKYLPLQMDNIYHYQWMIFPIANG